MLEVYRQTYHGKIETEVSYYFLVNNYGVKKFYEVIYEMISDTSHYYSKYHVDLNEKIEHLGKIENDVMKYTPLLFLRVRQKRRLAVLTKFILYIIAVTNNISIYRLPKKVVYHNNGVEVYLSSHAFVNSTYELIPLFEKIYR